MSKLHTSINFSFRKKELQNNEAEFFDLNASPIESELSNDHAENLQPIDINDGIIGDEDDIVTSEYWEREIAEWESMLIEEEISRLEEEEALRDNSGSLKGDLLTEYKHPAIDDKAKWELKSLFSSVIDTPSYLKENEV